MSITLKQVRSLSNILTSGEMKSELQGIMDKVKANASKDPNPKYVESLEMQFFYSKGSGRVANRWVGQVGADPSLGLAVESKRGTMSRALRESK